MLRLLLLSLIFIVSCAHTTRTMRTAPVQPRWCQEERPVYILASRALGDKCLANLRGAVDWWATQGVTYLSVMEADDADVPRRPMPRFITVTPDAPMDDAAADARWFRVVPACLSSVAIRAGGEYGCRRQTLAHELGHALGLVHHDDPTNLLFWTSVAHIDGPYGLDADQCKHVR